MNDDFEQFNLFDLNGYFRVSTESVLGGTDNMILKSLSQIDRECESSIRMAEMDLLANGDISLESVASPYLDNYLGYETAAKIKNMAARAKHNIVGFVKKVFSYVVNFIGNLIKGSINIKAVMKKYFKKANDYLNTLRGYAGKQFPEGEFQVSNYWGRISIVIVTILGITYLYDQFLTTLEQNDQKMKMQNRLGAFGCTLITINKNLLENWQNADPKALKKEADKKAEETSFFSNLFNKIKEIWGKVFGAAEQDGDMMENDAIKQTFNLDSDRDILQKVDIKEYPIVKMFGEEVEKADLSYQNAYAYMNEQLNSFITCSKNQNWDFGKISAKVTKKKQSIMKELAVIQKENAKVGKDVANNNKDANTKDGHQQNEQAANNVSTSDQAIMKASQACVTAGNYVKKVEQVIRIIIKNFEADMEGLFTEIVKFGSKLPGTAS